MVTTVDAVPTVGRDVEVLVIANDGVWEDCVGACKAVVVDGGGCADDGWDCDVEVAVEVVVVDVGIVGGRDAAVDVPCVVEMVTAGVGMFVTGLGLDDVAEFVVVPDATVEEETTGTA